MEKRIYSYSMTESLVGHNEVIASHGYGSVTPSTTRQDVPDVSNLENPSLNEPICDYILVHPFDPEIFLKMKLLENTEGREIYAVSLTTIRATEFFKIIDSKLLDKRRFYPQGDPTREFTRAIDGDEKRSHRKFWVLDNMVPGTEVSIYFAPLEGGSLKWTIGALDPNFNMPLLKNELSAKDVSAMTHYPINDGVISDIFLMASDKSSMIVIPLFRLLPIIILILICYWAIFSASFQTDVGFYHANTSLEWINITVIFSSIVMRKGFDTQEYVHRIYEAFCLAKKVHGNESLKKRIQIGAVFEFLNVLQYPLAVILSFYVAVYLSDNVFINVLLNIVALEFVSDVDEDLIAAYTSWRFGDDARVSVALLDITYAVNEDIVLWHTFSNSSKAKVREDLCKDDIDCAMRWKLLQSKSNGLGLLEKTDDGQEIVSSFTLQLDVIDWDTMSDKMIIKQGGMFLAATSEGIWEHHIDKRKRALLFQYFPETAIKFPWVGKLKFEALDAYGVNHAKHLVDLISNNTEVNSLSCWFKSDEANDCVKVIRDGLKENTSLHVLGINNSGLNDSAVMDIAELIRNNSTLSAVYLLNNKDIGDTAALILANALSEGDDANTTLDVIVLSMNWISTECQDKCKSKTHNRLVFVPNE